MGPARPDSSNSEMMFQPSEPKPKMLFIDNERWGKQQSPLLAGNVSNSCLLKKFEFYLPPPLHMSLYKVVLHVCQCGNLPPKWLISLRRQKSCLLKLQGKQKIKTNIPSMGKFSGNYCTGLEGWFRPIRPCADHICCRYRREMCRNQET